MNTGCKTMDQLSMCPNAETARAPDQLAVDPTAIHRI